MGTKTISIKDSVYRRLKRSKREDESFSDAIDSLLKKKNTDLMRYFGRLKGNSILNSIEEDSKEMRARVKVRL
ncbi:MAG: antitoxin VapB family protein [Euryarchaeota archaeon]|nr:antitoxin VapB family protein [Euryarchaeota archaeon]